MFTGIIETTEEVTQITPGKGEILLELRRPSAWKGIREGDSIAVNGVCLTVLKAPRGRLRFFCQTETLACSNLGTLRRGSRVNLERAVRLQDRLSGHLVQGHVDFGSRVLKVESLGESRRFHLSRPSGRRDIVHKGCIALDGISLTISRLAARSFAVDIIPFTRQATNICEWRKNTLVNVETDLFGKYAVALWREAHASANRR